VEVLPATKNNATNKVDRDSLKLPEENLGSRPCIGTSGDGRPTVADFDSRLPSEQSKQAVLEGQCLELFVLLKNVGS